MNKRSSITLVRVALLDVWGNWLFRQVAVLPGEAVDYEHLSKKACRGCQWIRLGDSL